MLDWISAVHRVLMVLALLLLTVDIVWGATIGVDADVSSYLFIRSIALLLAVGSWFYRAYRPDENLSTMSFAACFLIVFSASASIFNYLASTIAGDNIDAQLAAIDRAMGIMWPDLIQIAIDNPTLNELMLASYNSMLPQIAILIVCLSCTGQLDDLDKFCMSLAIGALTAIAIWTIMPSFGAFAFYGMPENLPSTAVFIANNEYAAELRRLMEFGPSYLAPGDVRGLIAFPSFHAAIAVYVTWYARNIWWLRWPAVIANLLVLCATPIQGGHHVVDIVAGIALAALTILCTSWLAAWFDVVQHTRRRAATRSTLTA